MRSFWFPAEWVSRRRWLGDNCGQMLNLPAACTWIHHLSQTIARLFASFLGKRQPFVTFFLFSGPILVDSSVFWNAVLFLTVHLISFSPSFSFVLVCSIFCGHEHVDLIWLFCGLPETMANWSWTTDYQGVVVNLWMARRKGGIESWGKGCYVVLCRSPMREKKNNCRIEELRKGSFQHPDDSTKHMCWTKGVRIKSRKNIAATLETIALFWAREGLDIKRRTVGPP